MSIFDNKITDSLTFTGNLDDDDNFADDHVMGDFNRHEPFDVHHDPVLYKDLRTKPRHKTRAKDVFKDVDDTQTYFGETMDDLALGNMAHQMGTDRELATAYNAGDQAKKRRHELESVRG